MKYIITLFVFSFFYIGINAQITTNITWVEKSSMNDADIIYYNLSKKLIWDNFKAEPNLPNPIAAITSSGFGYTAGMHSKNGKGQINVEVYCYFSKLESWVKEGKNTDYILNHEQHHFDATYIAAQLFLKKIKAIKLTTSNMNAQVALLYKECCTGMNNMQTRYDRETKNGQLTLQQEKWNTFFNEKLLTLKN
jgi:hypothetical protein